MKRATRRITFTDFLILRVYRDHPDERLTEKVILGESPDWNGLLNRLMKTEGILREDGTPNDIRRGAMFRSKGMFSRSLKLLRTLGYLNLNEITVRGIDLLDNLGKKWQDYPVYVPVDEAGYLDWSKVYYGEE